MPRNKSNLSQSSRNAKRMRLARSQEPADDREVRLSASRENLTRLRDSESTAQRESRCINHSSRMMISRLRENSEQREARLSVDREAHALSRESETFTDREVRLSSQRVRTASAQSQETPVEREARLTTDREAHALSLESETFTDSETRLSSQRLRTARARSQETPAEREARLTADREAHTLSRDSETFTDREARLSSQRVRTANARSQETSDAWEARLTADRERNNNVRSLENEYEHRRRLQTARENYELTRQSEEFFLSAEADRVRELRHEETAERRQSRLDTDRLQHTVNRLISSSVEDSESGAEVDTLLWVVKEKAGYFYSPRIEYSAFATIGRMVVCCHFCNALKWRKEPNGICCSGGKVLLENFREPPEFIQALLTGEHPQSKHFLDNIRLYNSAFQMTSFGAKQITEGPFMPTFKVQGQVYHLIGSLLPQNDPKFLQIYFVSNYNDQANIRNQNFPQLNINLITQLQDMLHQMNPYVTSFKAALESIPRDQNNDYKIIIKADRRPAAANRGRYNAPVVDEVAVILVDQECDRRDIVLRSRDDRLHRIYETHRAYDALQYPILYCHGEDGYNFGLYQVNPTTRVTNYNKKISALQFYSYQLQIRQNCFNYLQRFRGLFSQFIVDMYAKIETERLVYIRTNQTRLRAEEYTHLRDAMQHDSNVENMGRLVILPSSFIGGPRYMHERTQDAFCYVRKYGRPDLFITFTTNPKWIEISQELFPGQASYDRHDIIARVFHLKLKLMIDLITKEKVFGSFLCYMYSVEWQKRGLPHAHILLWLKEKIRPDVTDKIISAEFPNKNEDPLLFEIVKTHMVHGPCGTLNRSSPCMQDGHCSKKYPRALTEQTISGENGYPLYRRRSPVQGGFTAKVKLHGQEIVLDNRWVVPYSPVLSRTFQAHINVEICNSVESIKYICKYVNKGSDQATVGFTNNNGNDEVTRYQSGRYISSSEAVWRILSFPIHERHPPVIHLDVHLEGGQRVYFNQENMMERIENPRQTTLLAFFQLCQTDAFAKALLYNEIPTFYTYNKQQGCFNRRRRGKALVNQPGIFEEHVIGRVYTVHPNNSECFYLRMLLHVVRGPTSFIELRRVDDIVYPTYQAACRARHLLDGDQHWDNALSEASISESPHRLRHLFAVMLVFCALSDPTQLWQKYQYKLAEDLFRHAELNIDNEISERLYESHLNHCLLAIQDIVISIGGNPISQYGMPEPALSNERLNRDYVTETNYDPMEQTEILRSSVSRLTAEQRTIFDRVCQSVDSNLGETLFVDAPGGTGKTFLTKVILAKVRSQGKIALAVASSGIAATLLPGGKTAHTMFKIPIDLDRTESPVCNISRNSDKAKVLSDCNLIIWDECTMANRKAIEAVDRTLRDIKQNNQTMGGITVVFCGDFRQTLPVIPRGTRADEIRACIKSSRLWNCIITMHLTINMRARIGGHENAEEFSNLLLEIGNGIYPQIQGEIVLNENLCCTVSSIRELIAAVYGNEQIASNQNTWLCERAILTPRNDQAAAINADILSSIPGDIVEYISINRVMEEEETTNYPIEFLESLSAPGLPAHNIKLKVGVPIMLLRNLSPPKLCNGTRLRVTNLQRNLIEAEILTGCGAGDSVFIPRIPLIPNNFPFSFKRIQFPVSLCYAMTINKAQGQTMKVAGVDLSTSCFSHGQLYVALSRVSNPRNLFTLIPGGSTSNIVYREALL